MVRNKLWLFAAACMLLSARAAYAKVVGIGIAKSSSHVYAWFDDGTVSSGTSSNFARYTHPTLYNLPGNEKPSDILAISIAKNDHVYAWYRDGMVSVGTSTNLAHYKGLTPFKAAVGKSVTDIRAIGIAGSNDHTYAWYADGTVSSGGSEHLDAYQPAHTVQMPSGKSMAEVVEIDIAPDDRVYSWYTDGTSFVGTSTVLARWEGPRGYRAQMVIEAELKPGRHIIRPPHPTVLVGDGREREEATAIHSLPGPLGGGKPPGDITFRDVGKPSTAKLTAFATNPPTNGVDVMVAVSHDFMIVSDSSSLLFTDHNGVQLPKTPGGLDTVFNNVSDFFAQFVALDLNGAPNPLSISRNVGFASDCTQVFAPTTGKGICVDSVYDTRVFFDAETKRFFVQAHVRNPVWHGGAEKVAKGACGFVERPASASSLNGKTCPVAPHDTNKVQCPLFNRNDCELAHRHFLLAVSIDEDPRHGFHQFAITENVYGDYPWMAIHRNRVLLTVDTPTQPPSWPTAQPLVMVFSKDDLMKGAAQPAFFSYFPDDLGGVNTLTLVNEPGGEEMTLMLHVGTSKVRLFGFNDSNGPWKAPEVIKAAIAMDGVPMVRSPVFRNKRLYLVGGKIAENLNGAQRRSVRLIRFPVTTTANDILVSKDPSAGYLDYFFGFNSPSDPPQLRFSYEKPSIAVNKNGDMLFGYYRRPFAPPPNTMVFPDARVSFWPANATAPFASQQVMAGTGDPADGTIDYTTVVLAPDPLDVSFWAAQPFGVPGAFNVAIGHLTP